MQWQASSPILLLPVELKVEILALSDSFTTLFNLCSISRSFWLVYNQHKSTIQREIRRRNFTTEAIQLLDRFRPNSDGMGTISLYIFTHLHDFSNPILAPEKMAYLPFSDGDVLDKRRRAFGTENGFVASAKEEEFLLDLERLVGAIYRFCRAYGFREPKANPEEEFVYYSHPTLDPGYERAVGDEKDDSPEVQKRIRKAIYQFLIATTYYHDFTLITTGLRQPEALQDAAFYARLKAVRRAKEHSWRILSPGATPFQSTDYLKVVYDYRYLCTLTLLDLATISSIFKHSTTYDFLLPAWHEDDKFGVNLFIHAFLGRRCGMMQESTYTYGQIPNPRFYYDPLTEDWEIDENADCEKYLALSDACSAGAWREDYLERLERFRNAVPSFKIGLPEPELRARYPGYVATEVFTTTGLSALAREKEGDDEGGWHGGLVKKELVMFKCDVEDIAEMEEGWEERLRMPDYLGNRHVFSQA